MATNAYIIMDTKDGEREYTIHNKHGEAELVQKKIYQAIEGTSRGNAMIRLHDDRTGNEYLFHSMKIAAVEVEEVEGDDE
jgi:hypothetical protein